MGMTLDDAGGGETPAAQRTPTRRFEARRNAIVRSAIAELNRNGVRGMTLGDVAARLDLVPTGVIYHFKNKEELAAAVFQKGIDAFEAMVALSADRPTDTERLNAFLHAYFDYSRRADLGEADPLPVFNDVRALNNAAVNAAYIQLFKSFRGLLAPDLPRLHRNARAHLLLAQVFWIVAWRHHVEAQDYPRTADRMGAILTQGMLPMGAAWPSLHPLALDPAGEAGAPAGSPELFLRAATQLINEEGYHGASVERISAKLNVSKGAFYHHNQTKDELVAACFQRTFDVMWRAIHAAEAAGGTGLQVLASAVAALVEHQIRGEAPLLRTSALTAVPPAFRAELMDRFNRISFRFASILCDGIADGSIAPVDVNVAAQMLSTAINAAADLHFWTPGLAPETVVEHFVRPMFEGLASPAA